MGKTRHAQGVEAMACRVFSWHIRKYNMWVHKCNLGFRLRQILGASHAFFGILRICPPYKLEQLQSG